MSLGFVSYGLAAVGFLVLTLLLAISWEGRGQGARLVAACAANAVWAGLLAWFSTLPQLPLIVVMLAEGVRDGGWLFVLTGLLSGGAWPRLLTRATHLLVVAAIAGTIAIPFINAWSAFLVSAPAAYAAGGLVLALTGLVLLEQLFRNANPAGRFALKFLVIGVGVLFVYDLYLFSEAQLVKGIDGTSWTARGLVNALVVPLIALAARANPTWSLNVFVSRQVVFYTTTFLAVGAYLLVMAAGGYVIRLYGGTWGGIAQIVFFVGAGIVLVTLLASGSVRRRLRVFLSKNFYRNKYDYRVEWLRFIDTLASHGDDVDPYANAVRATAQIVGSPGGVLFMAVEDVPGWSAVAGWPAGDFPRARYPAVDPDGEFAGFLRRKQWVFDHTEYRRSPDTYQNIAVPEAIREDRRLRLVIPLVLQGELRGLVVLADPPPPFELTWEDRDLLKTLGRHVATHLAQHEADRRLAESRQFEGYHRLTAFVMHDLKNLAAQLSLLVANAEKHKRNPAFVDDAIATIANSTARMQRLIEQLQRREVQTTTRRVSLADIARGACQRCAIRAPEPRCADLDEGAWVDADPERLGMMVEHLIRNAQEATPATGSVTVGVTVERGLQLETGNSGIRAVSLRELQVSGQAVATDAAATAPAGDYACLTVTDSGCGMTDEFIKQRLFKPFDTTKGSQGMGIGAYQVRQYINSIGGRITVASTVGEGSSFSIRLPLRQAADGHTATAPLRAPA
jgi:putative PEP-CTERM system histidine kinase